MTNFLLATELRAQLDRIIELNPEAKLVADVSGMDHAVLDGFNLELDHDGDARFSLRSYGNGAKVTIKELTYER